jgi:hypothetical protein
VITAYRKAKKEKVELTLDYLKKQKFFFSSSEDFLWLAIIDKIKKNDEIAKIHLSKDYHKSNHFIADWIVPNYFYDIHDSMHNRYREEFVKFAQENGYATFNFNGGEFKKIEGEHHPVIWNMCNDIIDYNRMIEIYGGRK